MNFNVDGLRPATKYANNSINCLKDACSILSSIHMPSGLYIGEIADVKNSLYQIIDEIRNLNELVNDKIWSMTNAENRNMLLIDRVTRDLLKDEPKKEKNNIDISKRTNKINELPKNKSLEGFLDKVKDNIELNSKKASSIPNAEDVFIIDFFNKVGNKIKHNSQEFTILLARINGVDEYFSYFQSINGQYGVDQGIFRHTITQDGQNSDEYQRLLKVLETKYNMSTKDAVILMKYLDSIGACSYARAADYLVTRYALQEDEFYNKFGFPLYIEDSEGNIVLNSGELLLDLYIKENTLQTGYGSGGNMERTNSKLVFLPDALDEKNERFNHQSYIIAGQLWNGGRRRRRNGRAFWRS